MVQVPLKPKGEHVEGQSAISDTQGEISELHRRIL